MRARAYLKSVALLDQAKVCEPEVSVRVDENVLRLEIPVDNVHSVQVLDGEDDLRAVHARVPLIELFHLLQAVEELPSRTVVCHKANESSVVSC